MISPEEIKQQMLRWWPQVLKSHVRGEGGFPLVIDRIGKVRSSQVRQQFDKIQDEVQTLLKQSKNETGIGYLIETSKSNFRRSGVHELPERIVIECLKDYLHVTGKRKEWDLFVKNYALISDLMPLLKEWSMNNTSWLINIRIDWKNILLVCNYFLMTPRPECYVRQLPLPIHTKFIEENNALLVSLLDSIIPEHIRDSTQKRFAHRYYLKHDEPLVRIRILDDKLAFQNKIRDVSLPLSAFEALNFDCKSILIAENKMNFLTLPEVQNGIALWSGGGFNVSYLKNIDWLSDKQIFYWGDIDEHGFQILHQLRSYYPGVVSVMMDIETYSTFRQHTVQGEIASLGNLDLLTTEELLTLRTIQSDPSRNRLEQEKIPNWYVINKLAK